MKSRILGVIVLLVVSGCALKPTSFDQAFLAAGRVQGSAESIPDSMELTWGRTLEVLSQQGFIVQQLDTNNHIILASRELQDPVDQSYSYSLTVTLMFVPLADQMTRVMMAANQTTELHRERYVWWRLLGLIPVFPIDTEYATSVVTRDTVRSPQFYRNFFNTLKDSIEEEKFLQPSVRSPTSAPPVPAPPPPAVPSAPQPEPSS
jgi:hypothetical protein